MAIREERLWLSLLPSDSDEQFARVREANPAMSFQQACVTLSVRASRVESEDWQRWMVYREHVEKKGAMAVLINPAFTPAERVTSLCCSSWTVLQFLVMFFVVVVLTHLSLRGELAGFAAPLVGVIGCVWFLIGSILLCRTSYPHTKRRMIAVITAFSLILLCVGNVMLVFHTLEMVPRWMAFLPFILTWLTLFVVPCWLLDVEWSSICSSTFDFVGSSMYHWFLAIPVVIWMSVLVGLSLLAAELNIAALIAFSIVGLMMCLGIVIYAACMQGYVIQHLGRPVSNCTLCIMWIAFSILVPFEGFMVFVVLLVWI